MLVTSSHNMRIFCILLACMGDMGLTAFFTQDSLNKLIKAGVDDPMDLLEENKILLCAFLLYAMRIVFIGVCESKYNDTLPSTNVLSHRRFFYAVICAVTTWYAVTIAIWLTEDTGNGPLVTYTVAAVMTLVQLLIIYTAIFWRECGLVPPMYYKFALEDA